MSDHPHKKNRQPPGTLPNQRRSPKPGRNRPAKGYLRAPGFDGLWTRCKKKPPRAALKAVAP